MNGIGVDENIAEGFFLEVSRGNVAGMEFVRQPGFNPDMGTVIEDIWDAGDAYVFSTAAEKVNIVSDNAVDTSAGTGARTIRLTGLNSSFVEITEDLTRE